MQMSSPINSGQESPDCTPVQGPDAFVASTKAPTVTTPSRVPRASPNNSKDCDEAYWSPLSHLSLDSLRKKHAKMSLTGDSLKGSSPSAAGQTGQAGAWQTRRFRGQPTGDDTTPSRQVTQTSTPTRQPGTSRFALFSMSALKSLGSSPSAAAKDDELINLDIDSALFPDGAPLEGEYVSSTAFKGLQTNALDILRKYQAAYRHKAAACHELRAERDAQNDERIEMETRAKNLQSQLESMAKKAAEAEAIMQGLMEELTREQKLHAEERGRYAGKEATNSIMSSGMSIISEDLGAEEDQNGRSRRRRSSGSYRSDDVGSDTDGDSFDGASVFSRPDSVTDLSSYDGSHQSVPPVPALPRRFSKVTAPDTARASQAPPPQISKFQKLFKGIAGEAKDTNNANGLKWCNNCKGQDASVAWDTASLLRVENQGLKQRVGELEEAVDGALDAVMGVKL